MALASDDLLILRLTQGLPLTIRFFIHHLSSPAVTCPPIFSNPPGAEPESTECESHFLSAAIDHNGGKLHVFAVEVLVYTTSTLTTIFVSKADSTGYLHLLNIKKGTPSPLKKLVLIFLAYLVETKYRKGVRLVLSLFARAQDQYLFPGSIENSGKHVLDDRRLIRWWCQIIDSIFDKLSAKSSQDAPIKSSNSFYVDGPRSRGYLRVPGCDFYETNAFLPRASLRKQYGEPRWLSSDPLRLLGKPRHIQDRCLIPRFPDDPKARFLTDLDDELMGIEMQPSASPSKSHQIGMWRSVKSLEQFWEMMTFRQECAAGRLVGFIWGLFTPLELVDRPFDILVDESESSNELKADDATLPLPISPKTQDSEPPLHPTIHSPSPNGRATPDFPVQIILDETAYKRCMDLLVKLDYADVRTALASTQKWLDATANELGMKAWGREIIGERHDLQPVSQSMEPDKGAAVLNATYVRKKRKLGISELEGKNGPSAEANSSRENLEGEQILPIGLGKKKTKINTVA